MSNSGDSLESEDWDLRNVACLEELIELNGFSQGDSVAGEGHIIIFVVIFFVDFETEVVLVNALARGVLVLRGARSVSGCYYRMAEDIARVLLVGGGGSCLGNFFG